VESHRQTHKPNDVDELVDGNIALREAPDVLVQRTRPIVVDLVGEGRIGVGTLVAPADPIVILDGLAYRLDAEMSASPISPLARLRSATVVDAQQGSRFPIDDRVRLIDIAHLPAHLFGAPPPIMAVQLSGSFAGVTAPNGVFGRTQGIAVGFLTQAARKLDWHLGFLTSDRTFGGRVLDISIEHAELTIWAPRVVYQAQMGEETTTSSPTAALGRTPAEER
jgi:alpha-acetolactate decarboxylase